MPMGMLDSALLVRAAVSQGTDAHDAFLCWLATRDLGQLPPGEFELLPMLARRYEEDISRQPEAAKITGVYRRSWYGNQFALHGMRKAADTLTAADVSFVVVGDAAQALTVYPDLGARPIRVVSLLITPAALDASIALLTAQGWCLTGPTASARHVWRTTYRFQQGNWAALELSPHLMPDSPIAAADAEARTHAVAANVENVLVACADETALLLQCAGAPYLRAPLLLVDTALLVASGAIAWPRVLEVAAQSDLGPALLALLRACGDASGCEAPATVMHSLHELPSTAFSREAAAIALVVPQQRSRAQRFAWHYARFRRIAVARGIAPSPAAALSYGRSVRDSRDSRRTRR